MPQDLLQRNSGDVVQVGELSGLLPGGQKRGGLGIADALTVFPPRTRARFQRQVVDLPYAPDRARELSGLRGRRIKAELERPLNGRTCHGSDFIALMRSFCAIDIYDVPDRMTARRVSLPRSAGKPISLRPVGRVLNGGNR